MVQDLKSVNRSVTPWVIVHGHRPAYATVVDTSGITQAQDQRNAFEDIFVQFGVSSQPLVMIVCKMNMFIDVCVGGHTVTSLGSNNHATLGVDSDNLCLSQLTSCWLGIGTTTSAPAEICF